MRKITRPTSRKWSLSTHQSIVKNIKKHFFPHRWRPRNFLLKCLPRVLMFSDKRSILSNHLHDKVVQIVKMTSHQHSIEVTVTNDDFLLGYDPEGCLESDLDTNDDDFVGDKRTAKNCPAKTLRHLTGKPSNQTSKWLTVNVRTINICICLVKWNSFKASWNAHGTFDSISTQDMMMLIHSEDSSITRTFIQSNIPSLKKSKTFSAHEHIFVSLLVRVQSDASTRQVQE